MQLQPLIYFGKCCAFLHAAIDMTIKDFVFIDLTCVSEVVTCSQKPFSSF